VVVITLQTEWWSSHFKQRGGHHTSNREVVITLHTEKLWHPLVFRSYSNELLFSLLKPADGEEEGRYRGDGRSERGREREKVGEKGEIDGTGKGVELKIEREVEGEVIGCVCDIKSFILFDLVQSDQMNMTQSNQIK
jgi:hypothetical protein